LVTGSGFKDMLSVENNFYLPNIERVGAELMKETINNHNKLTLNK
jgi:hypothetical protein